MKGKRGNNTFLYLKIQSTHTPFLISLPASTVVWQLVLASQHVNCTRIQREVKRKKTNKRVRLDRRSFSSAFTKRCAQNFSQQEYRDLCTQVIQKWGQASLFRPLEKSSTKPLLQQARKTQQRGGGMLARGTCPPTECP